MRPLRQDFRDFFPNSCVLDGDKKYNLYLPEKNKLLEITGKMNAQDRRAFRKNISLSKPRSMEIIKKVICVNCTHPLCRHRPKSTPTPTQ